jgi:hypothetical protein
MLGAAALVLALVAWIGFNRWMSRYGPDLLERTSKRLAGPAAVNCGEVPVGGNPKEDTGCALAAQQAGKLFGFDTISEASIAKLPSRLCAIRQARSVD